ncbi:MAG: tyrosine-type recombinase/integrase, partial [Bacteroidales bacterium]
STGMRLSELINIKLQDIDFYECTIKVLGKRNKERIIPFGSNLKDILIKYLNRYDKKFGELNNNRYIFVGLKGNRIYPKAVYKIVRKYLDMVTTIDKRSPHVLRHTFATHLLNNGADINAIKEILGHSSLSATQIYTHNSIEKLKSIYKQAHPRA